MNKSNTSLQTKPAVRLYELTNMGLIIPWKTGVVYINQVGGHVCQQRKMEGFFLPLENESLDYNDKLNEYFTGSQWGGWCDKGINEQTADYIDELLAAKGFYSWLKVERRKLKQSCEAWVYVKIIHNAVIELFLNFQPKEAVLTWENSD